MEKAIFIRWCDSKERRLVYLTAHRNPEDAARFVAEYNENSGSSLKGARPEISGNEGRVVGAYAIPTNGKQIDLLDRLSKEDAIIIPVDPQNPSPELKAYHALRGAFAESAAIPMVRLDVAAALTARARMRGHHPQTH